MKKEWDGTSWGHWRARDGALTEDEKAALVVAWNEIRKARGYAVGPSRTFGQHRIDERRIMERRELDCE